MKIKKMIGGGQSGADQGGIIFAIRNGIPYCINIFRDFRPTRGWHTEILMDDGLSIHSYNVVEKHHYVANLIARTKYNVENSDLTIIFVNKPIEQTKGSFGTMRDCKKLRKPYYVIQTYNTDNLRMNFMFFLRNTFRFVKHQNISLKDLHLRINIAGQRELDEEEVCKILEKILL